MSLLPHLDRPPILNFALGSGYQLAIGPKKPLSNLPGENGLMPLRQRAQPCVPSQQQWLGDTIVLLAREGFTRASINQKRPRRELPCQDDAYA